MVRACRVVRETIPALVSREVGMPLQAVEFMSDGEKYVQIVLQGPPVVDTDTAPRFLKTYKLNLTEGVVHGTKIDLWGCARRVVDMQGLALQDNMEMKRNVDWSDFVAKIPGIVDDLRYVRQHTWAVYNRESGLWTEYENVSCDCTHAC